jgi:hypothetical protein
MNLNSSNVVTNLLKGVGETGNAIKVTRVLPGLDANHLVSLASDGDSEIRGTLYQSEITDGEAILAENSLIPRVTGLHPDAKSLLAEIDEENPSQYKYPRYFGQTGQRRGFTYMYQTRSGTVSSVQFTNGVYATKDIWLIDKLQSDIARQRGGIGASIQNITDAYYNEIVGSAAQYNTMLVGTVGSDKGNPHRLLAEQEKKQLKETLEAQAQRIKQLEAEVLGKKNYDTNLTSTQTPAPFSFNQPN